MKKNIRHENHSFNAEHYAGVSLNDFIKAELPSVTDNHGTEEDKIEFLKEAYAKINPSASVTLSSAEDNGRQDDDADPDEHQ